jgi:hypothetical protein
MSENIWYNIDVQEQKASSVPELESKKIERFIQESLGSNLKKYYKESYFLETPLSYYTKSCSWAVDYVWSLRRVLVYLNPSKLKKYGWSNYILWEFGCKPDLFNELVSDGWIIPQLNKKDNYDNKSIDEIEKLFKVAEKSPLYVNIIDDAIAHLADSSCKTLLEFDNKYRTDFNKKPWKLIPQNAIPIEGVDVSNLRDYIIEKVLKLEMLKKASNFEFLSNEILSIENMVKEFLNNKNNKDLLNELIYKVYMSWNIYGTPIFYSDYSGFSDIGCYPFENNILTYLQRTLKKIRNKLEDTKTIITKDQDTNRILLPDEIYNEINKIFDARKYVYNDFLNDSQKNNILNNNLINRSDNYLKYYREIQPDFQNVKGKYSDKIKENNDKIRENKIELAEEKYFSGFWGKLHKYIPPQLETYAGLTLDVLGLFNGSAALNLMGAGLTLSGLINQAWYISVTNPKTGAKLDIPKNFNKIIEFPEFYKTNINYVVWTYPYKKYNNFLMPFKIGLGKEDITDI